MADNPTLRITVDCDGLAPPQTDDDDTQRILDAVLKAFFDPDPGDVNVVIDYTNTPIGRTPDSTIKGPWVTARVHDEGDHWTIDLVNERGDYSEFVWDHYVDETSDMTSDRPGNFDTMQQALVRVPEFIAEHGAEETWNTILIVGVFHEDIRIELTQAGGDYRVSAPPPFGEAYATSLDKAIAFVAEVFHAIECPKCGHDDELQVMEDRALYWTLAVEDRQLVNNTGFEVSDAGGNERMFCGACGHTFPKPATWEIVYH